MDATSGAQVGSTAASTTPAPVAPSAAPSTPAPAAAPATTATDAGSSAAPAHARDDAGRFTARPIPNKRPLIGMDDIPDDDFLTDGEKAARNAGKQIAKQVAAADGTAPAQQPAPAQKFAFAGEQWDSPAAAEQNFRTLRGLHRAQQQQIAQSQQTAAQYQQAYQQLQARLAALESRAQNGQSGPPPASEPAAPGTPAGGQKPNAPTGAKAFYERLGIDLNVYDQIAQLHGPGAASAWLMSEVSEKQNAAQEARFQELIKPFAQQQEFLGRVSSVSNTFNQVASYRIGDQLAYPEMQDPQAAQYIGQIWKSLPVSDEKRHSPEALVMAVVMYREFARQHQASLSAASPQSTQQPAAPQDAAGAAAAAARVASAVVSGNSGSRGSDAISGNQPPAVRPSLPSAAGFDADQFRRGIDQAGTAIASLGFAR